tara:strand:- start:2251 stop:2559 length:309 start_codon:yes stop_codon:yes gene_type:complete
MSSIIKREPIQTDPAYVAELEPHDEILVFHFPVCHKIKIKAMRKDLKALDASDPIKPVVGVLPVDNKNMHRLAALLNLHIIGETEVPGKGPHSVLLYDPDRK